MHCSAVVQWTLYGEGIKGVSIAIGTKMVGFGQPARVYIHKNNYYIYICNCIYTIVCDWDQQFPRYLRRIYFHNYIY